MSVAEFSGDGKDIVVSTRIRLARNLKNYPFATKLSAKQAREMIAAIYEALQKNPALKSVLSFIKLSDLDDLTIQSFVEQHLISPEFAKSTAERSLVLSNDRHISIMINEEDHIRLQVMGTGLCLNKCLDEAVKLDLLLDETLMLAFNEELGYLTHCPTNLGTGLRASVMLHLPMLTRCNEITKMIADAGKIGIAVRGIYGEGSVARSELYQISNQFTLGFSEQETVERLKGITDQIISQEQILRKAALAQARDEFEDRVYRSAATLQNARIMSASEAENLLSDLRLGISCGLINGIDYDSLNSMLYDIGPANIAVKNGSTLPPKERDKYRAEYLRNSLRSKLKE
ncbi:MAG: protein arginine kinase [Clostridiales bacterium]|nr:protein arginine kinase [Clostridiales bacterium]